MTDHARRSRSGSDDGDSECLDSADPIAPVSRMAPDADRHGVLAGTTVLIRSVVIRSVVIRSVVIRSIVIRSVVVRSLVVRSLVVLSVALLATGTASAHTGLAGSGISALEVVAISALVGTGTGLAAVAVGTRRVVGVVTHRRFNVALAIGLTGLGVTFVLPVLADAPAVAIAGAGAGAVLARWVPHHHARALASERGRLVLGVVAAIGLHRLVEGVVLATGFLAGTSIGLLTAVVVTVHAAGETVVAATLLTLDGRARAAVLAVLAIQAGFVLAAAGTVLASLSLPIVFRSIGVAVAAGVLVYVGTHECKQCFLAWRGTA